MERGREERTSPSTCERKLEARDSLGIDIFWIDVGRAWLQMFDALLQPCPATRLSRNADDTPTGLSFMWSAPALQAMHRPAALFCLAARKKKLDCQGERASHSRYARLSRRMWDRVVHAIAAARGYQTRVLGHLKDQINVQVQMVAAMAHGTRVGRRQCFGTKRGALEPSSTLRGRSGS